MEEDTYENHLAYARKLRWRLGKSAATALLAVIAILAVVGVGSTFRATGATEETAANQQSLEGESTTEPSAGEARGFGSARELVVYVTGEVHNGGVYGLAPGSRVADAIEAAGGLTENAAIDDLNLARVVVDGEHLKVLTVEEVENAVDRADASEPGTSGEGRADCVDINLSGASQWEMIDGIGPKLAQRIVDHRDKQGNFTSAEDLLNVSGIGPVIYQAAVDKLC